MRTVILGLSITSSWGNGHATTYRGLVHALAARGHDVLFLERDMPWYAQNRDLPQPPYGHTALYAGLEDLRLRFEPAVAAADLVMVGSYVPDGVALGRWVLDTARGVTAFYDIDTPVTLAALGDGSCTYLAPDLVSRYALYLSFAGGPILDELPRRYGVRMPRPLYCAVDPAHYYPEQGRAAAADDPWRWDLGYMGTYSEDRQPALERLLLEPARRLPGRRFVVVGPQYPAAIAWPDNVTRLEHLPPSRHRAFYTAQRFTLNITRAAMVEAGYSPSIRLFEAAACATPIISDRWAGLDRFFRPGDEVLVVDGTDEVVALLDTLGADERAAIGRRARARALAEHTAEHRVVALEGYVDEARALLAGRREPDHPWPPTRYH